MVIIIMENPKNPPQYQTFNPVKESTADGRSSVIQWSTTVLEKAVNGLAKGKRLIANPFYENNVKLLKPELVFVKTAWEVQEWKKCANDLPYFIENYAKFMTPQGLRKISLRDYQWEYLDLLLHNQLTIMRSCRQAGKCISFISKVLIKIKDTNFETCQALKNIQLKKYFIDKDTYELPLYEIYNCFDRSFRWKIQYYIYKLIDRLIYAK